MTVRKMKPIIIDISSVEYPVVPEILSTSNILNDEKNSDKQSLLLIKTLEKYIDFLSLEIKKRKHLVERSLFINKICFLIEISLFILDALIGFSGLFFGSASSNIILQICIFFTSISGILHVFIKKTYSSNHQQVSLLVLAENRYQSIHAKYTSAKIDNIITPEEYNIIVDDFKLYEKSIKEIMNNGKSTFDIEKFEPELKS